MNLKYCDTCQRNKNTQKRMCHYTSPDIPNKPNEKISIDLMGLYKITKKANRYILVVQDYLTRFLIIEPITNKSLGAVIQALWTSFLRIHGKSRIILTDKGTEFALREFAEVIE